MRDTMTIRTLAIGFLTMLLILGTGCARKEQKPSQPFGTISHVVMEHTLDPESHGIESEVTLSWSGSPTDTLFFLLHSGLEVEHIEVSGAASGELLLLAEGERIGERLLSHTGQTDPYDSKEHLVLHALPLTGRQDTVTLTFYTSGVIHDDVTVAGFSRWEIADETTGLIDPRGTFLTPGTAYYPTLPGEIPLSTFETTIHHPEGWEALVEGNLLERSPGSVRFASGQRIDGSYLVAGPYELQSIVLDGIEIAMYHYPQSADMVDRYLQFSTRYMKMYEEMLGDYAFERFSVVENWFPTGYGMPSFTLLGTDVLRLPFIVFTSLGHEICHNWWGNGVLVDYETGNWCEGLTTYCADYHYKVLEGSDAARQYRLDVLRDYSDYVIRGDEEDFAVRAFTSRTTAGTRTIGYGKVMMIFHMIEQRIGSDIFWTSLKDVYQEKMFERAGWADFMSAFAEASGERFDQFERQWVDRPGAPDLAISNPHVQSGRTESGKLVEFDIQQRQPGEPFLLDIPIRIHDKSGSVTEHILRDVRGRMYHARVETEGNPVSVEIDPDFHLFRVLDTREAPATLSGFFADEKPLVVIPGGGTGQMYREFAERFLARSDAEYLLEGDFQAANFAGRTFLRFGESDALRNARAELTVGGEGLAIVAASRDSSDPSIVHLDIYGDSIEALMAIASKLPHYGKYSYLAFNAGQNNGKGQWEVTDSPLHVALP